ncbi:hypothetical protein LZ554_009601 [Drepanopeziza brunnea f. sp. 'monogermtubi']|nr:hypothetical protein LZ554_009601 [Drepanopeziza brunnea f. sp. 'monogermtubi']
MPYYDHQSLRELLGLDEEAFEEVKGMMQQVFLAHLVGLTKTRLNCSPNKEKVDAAIAECIEGFQGFVLIDQRNMVPVAGMLRMYASMITNNKRLRDKEGSDGRRASTEPPAKKPRTKRRGSEDDMGGREEMDTQVMVEAGTRRKFPELDNAGLTSDMSAALPAESVALPAGSFALPVEAQSTLPALPAESVALLIKIAQRALPAESTLPAVLGTSQQPSIHPTSPSADNTKPSIHPAAPSADIPRTFSTLLMARKLMQGRHGSLAEPGGISALHQIPALGMSARHGTSISQEAAVGTLVPQDAAVATTTTAAARPALGERSRNINLASARGFRSMQLRNQLNKEA